MKPSRNAIARQTAILKHLKQHGRAMVDDLAEMFRATPQTIRKDLNALAEVDQIARFHGGAALVGGAEYLSFSVREEFARDEKEAIGRAVAGLVPNNSSLLINAGTTTVAFARNLLHHVGLRLVADSVLMANEIKGFVGVETMVPAGIVRKADGAVLGDTAADFVRQFRADTAVIGVAAIAADGALLDFDLGEVSMVRAIMASARDVILAADSTKFGRAAPICIAQLEQINTLVTDSACPDALREMCAARDVRLVIAE